MLLRFLIVGIGAAFAAAACGDSSSSGGAGHGGGQGLGGEGGAGAGAPEGWITNIEQEPPLLLSDVGAFADVQTRRPSDLVVTYTPRYPLFSDGLEKDRLLYVPAGQTIEASTADWQFPVGTVLVKTFLDGDTPVETRLLFRRQDEWDYALYAWREDGSDADLLEGNWAEKEVELADGTSHFLPARLDCRTCHETSEEAVGNPVLGVSALQLSDDLAGSELFATAPSVEPVEGASVEETKALRYFIGNCVSCHNGGEATNASFSLYPDKAVELTVGVETEAETGEGIRVVPGNPEASVLYISVVRASEPDYPGPFKKMPPLGLTRRDPEIEPILRDWIEGL